MFAAVLLLRFRELKTQKLSRLRSDVTLIFLFAISNYCYGIFRFIFHKDTGQDYFMKDSIFIIYTFTINRKNKENKKVHHTIPAASL